jgi:ubiquinone biosynthesis accessory factor UbiJ
VSEGGSVPDAVLATLETVVNYYLSLDPEGAARLGDLQGRVILIELAGFGTRVYVVPGDGGLQLFGDYAGEPDCVLYGTPLALARMGVSGQREDQLFSGEVRIAGDTHLAQAFGNFLGGLEVDWEEQLSRLLGDAAAHQVGVQVRSVERWGRRTSDILTQDIQEYLQEEARLLPGRYETRAFLDDVDRLRDDVDRLAARVERLANALGEGRPDRETPAPESDAQRVDMQRATYRDRAGE